jgi:hypothetical protein
VSSIDFTTFKRVLTRSRKFGLAPETNPLVAAVYQTVLGAQLDAYLAADAAVTTARNNCTKEAREALAAVRTLDQPYQAARSAVAAVLPDVQVPLTLASLGTDTDKQNAVEALLHIIDDHHAEQWATILQAGEFGQKAPAVLLEIDDKVKADEALQKAQTQRAAAYGVVHDLYLRFKRVVRSTYGAKSIEYHRIHVTKAGKLSVDDADTDEAAPAPGTPAPAAPAPAKPVPA